ncbi:hypothetical protein [Synechococcus sp. RS9902]|uniref:hypothetical protein n=1 Tax=Synechococcus sp. RS9902 TaxID=221345 RepID=UPI001645740C|nr:hypothetical protein [Synechococcus sp. RS9902]QNI98425.1 putative membrane protein [Synechococcus sp. RS9902]
MLFLLWLVASVVIGFVCSVAGSNKGVGGIRWFVLALLIGPFALLAVAAMPDLKTRRILRLIAEQQGGSLTEDGEETSAVDRANEILKKKRGY